MIGSVTVNLSGSIAINVSVTLPFSTSPVGPEFNSNVMPTGPDNLALTERTTSRRMLEFNGTTSPIVSVERPDLDSQMLLSPETLEMISSVLADCSSPPMISSPTLSFSPCSSCDPSASTVSLDPSSPCSSFDSSRSSTPPSVSENAWLEPLPDLGFPGFDLNVID